MTLSDFERVASGIPGLDDLMEGGFPRNFIILVSGSSGTGKTTLCIQYLVEGLKHGEKGVYIGLGESSNVMKKSILRYGIDLDKLAEHDKLIFADIPALDLEEVSQLIDGMGPDVKRLVIDPISALLFKFDRDIDLRQKIRELTELIRDKGVTALITTEIPENSELISRFGIEDFLADGIIVLYYFREGARCFRDIEVRKMRGTAHSDLVHLYKLEPDFGVRVYPNEKAIPE